MPAAPPKPPLKVVVNESLSTPADLASAVVGFAPSSVVAALSARPGWVFRGFICLFLGGELPRAKSSAPPAPGMPPIGRLTHAPHWVWLEEAAAFAGMALGTKYGAARCCVIKTWAYVWAIPSARSGAGPAAAELWALPAFNRAMPAVAWFLCDDSHPFPPKIEKTYGSEFIYRGRPRTSAAGIPFATKAAWDHHEFKHPDPVWLRPLLPLKAGVPVPPVAPVPPKPRVARGTGLASAKAVIEHHFEKTQRILTKVELARELGLSSPTSAYRYLKEMEAEGYLFNHAHDRPSPGPKFPFAPVRGVARELVEKLSVQLGATDAQLMVVDATWEIEPAHVGRGCILLVIPPGIALKAAAAGRAPLMVYFETLRPPAAGPSGVRYGLFTAPRTGWDVVAEVRMVVHRA